MRSSSPPTTDADHPDRPRHEIVLVTCRMWPDLSTSDHLLADELRALGHRVVARSWNDADVTEFTAADIVVLRSNWDYHHELGAFQRWLAEVEAGKAILQNPADLVRSHLDKSYLTSIEAAGFRTPRTLAAPVFDAAEVDAWAGEHGLDTLVMKPAWGASGHDVDLVRRADLADAEARWRRSDDRRSVIVQEFVPEVAAGEYALVYFAGEYSHALLRTPSSTDFRVNGQYGGSMELAGEVGDELIAFGSAVVAAFAAAATYVRVDVVAAASGPILMEFEVNEPALGLDLAPGAATRFAQAIVAD